MSKVVKNTRSLREFFRQPYVNLLYASVVNLSLYLFLELSPLEIPEIQSWFLSLTTATVGSYLTAIAVDKSFRDKERRERERIRTTALESLRTPLKSHLSLLAGWYVAASVEGTLDEPDSFRTLLEEGDFTETVQYLDFGGEVPTTTPDQDWLNYSANELLMFNQEIDEALTKHGAFLDPEIIESLELIADSTMSSVIISGERNKPGIQRWKERNEVKRDAGSGNHFSVVLNEQVEEHVENVLTLIEHYEERGFQFTSLERSPSEDSVLPSVESARLNITLEQ